MSSCDTYTPYTVLPAADCPTSCLTLAIPGLSLLPQTLPPPRQRLRGGEGLVMPTPAPGVHTTRSLRPLSPLPSPPPQRPPQWTPLPDTPSPPTQRPPQWNLLPDVGTVAQDLPSPSSAPSPPWAPSLPWTPSPKTLLTATPTTTSPLQLVPTTLKPRGVGIATRRSGVSLSLQ